MLTVEQAILNCVRRGYEVRIGKEYVALWKNHDLFRLRYGKKQSLSQAIHDLLQKVENSVHIFGIAEGTEHLKRLPDNS